MGMEWVAVLTFILLPIIPDIIFSLLALYKAAELLKEGEVCRADDCRGLVWLFILHAAVWLATAASIFLVPDELLKAVAFTIGFGIWFMMVLILEEELRYC